MSVEPAHHDGDQPWYEEALVSVAGRLFPPRFRISLRCAATKIEMCTAVEVEQGGFIEPDNATSVAGLSSGVEKDYVRASARKLALPLALATMPDDAFEQSSQGWTWAVAGWSPGSTMRTSPADSRQTALLEELRRRCGPKWWSIYLPRIEKTAEIVWEAPADWPTRRVITALVCPATHVGRTQAYADLQAAREIGLLPPSEDMKAR
ncbi:hypothetical protein P8A18_34225 (plasmid) [Streptomyces castrisilvae]|uniref:Uncharacterized protein n=1 Tax=Streptomyces castrisilvae TaxID=3033811 RepID=A0ABY9HVI9_9ACTN|nr:hypothetical protein [Streptomyces sp. Mut1]WLQ38582.1 hypothetical protein P8A18_34225 [Streptomyces sp. Mut1]